MNAPFDGKRPDWLDTAVLNGVWLELPGHGVPRLYAAVRDGLPLGVLPPSCQLPGLRQLLKLHRVRAPRAVAQAAPELRPRARPAMVGTATALLRGIDGGQSYLLTCAHVATPTLERAFGAKVDVSHGSAIGVGSLTDWRPAPAAGPEHSKMDAAILLVDDALALAFRRDGSLLPAGIGGSPRAGQPVTMLSRRGQLDGTLMVYWSGPVDVPGLSAGEADYFLDDAIGYRCDSRPGDSGGAVRDAQDCLMGMHIAGLDGAESGEANAVYGPIGPVLDTFRASPWLRSGAVGAAELPRAGAVAGGSARTGSAPTIGSTTLSESDVVACTLWGEARNQGEEGMHAVACVIANRWHSRYRKCASAQAVCLDPWQFSCWLKNDPNQPRMLAVARRPDGPYQAALAIAGKLLQRTLGDITRGARHYYATSLREPPKWARGKAPCVVIGDHRFFNDVD